jgi:hypothetical protein
VEFHHKKAVLQKVVRPTHVAGPGNGSACLPEALPFACSTDVLNKTGSTQIQRLRFKRCQWVKYHPWGRYAGNPSCWMPPTDQCLVHVSVHPPEIEYLWMRRTVQGVALEEIGGDACNTAANADNGRGMSPERQARLFGAFLITKGMGKTGLALWISSEIMESHQGCIKLRSSRRADQPSRSRCRMPRMAASSSGAAGELIIQVCR